MLPALVLLNVLAFVGALAGTTGKIAGRVRDAKSGEALIGANVVLVGTTMGAATDLEGYYTILNIPPGKYTVIISSLGYTRKTVSDVAVSIDLTTKVDADLTETSFNVQEVVVTAERPAVKKDLTSSESRVDASAIKTLPVQETSQVIALQAGVTQGRFGEIHIRGGRSNRSEERRVGKECRL